MNTQDIVNNFVDFALNKPNTTPDLHKLSKHLDRLGRSVNEEEFEYDSSAYPEPPEDDYQEIRAIIGQKFPQLENPRSQDAPSELPQGTATDDLTEIVICLIEAKWFFENTSYNHALWSLDFDHKIHWGLHLTALQSFLK